MRKLKTSELGRKTAEEFRESEKLPVVVLLDNVRSAYNVGSVFRTADAFCIEAIYLCGITAYPPHKGIIKTALGAEKTVAWKYFKNTPEAIKEIRERGYKVYAVEQAEGSIFLNEFSVSSWSAKRTDSSALKDGIRLSADRKAEQLATNSKDCKLQITNCKLALVFGHEVNGIQQDILSRCDGCIEIPQGGTKHSLNIAVSAGVALWEIFKTYHRGS